MCENEPRDFQGYRHGRKPISGRIRKYIANLRCNIPRKQKEDEDVKKTAPMHIESCESASLQILFLSVSGTSIPPLLSVIINHPILFGVLRTCV